eukprot:TRINITY_DN4513_c0_g1_i3.p1 TRINITY_DN4513_c0_g1~~TRINITY_DN4513_c0_g1_i3.p1  ORF type:complete len:754 (+),score=230.40 TRINITY_DN4513_c0_g1_i3:1558-3819(+)
MTPKRKKKPTPIDSPRSTPSPALDGVSRTESVMVVTPPPQLLKPGSTPRQCVDVHAENRLKEGLLKVRGKETVKVMVRVRPFMPHEIAKSRDKGFSLEPTVAVTEKECSVVDDNGVVKDKYKFDRCFWSMPAEQASGPHVAGQADVFEVMGKPSVKHAFYGYNACIFAYGQTGSGKTHSMLGTDADPGLAPRIVRKIYDTIEGIQQDGEKTRFELRICFMEIYNEKVMDLLVDGTPKKKGVKSPRGDKYRECKVRYSPDKGTYVEGINRILVTSAAECLKLMHGGMAYRATAAHAMNDQSSRSHAIFQICLKQTTVLGTTLVSLVNIVDLAGSERVKMTKATGTVLDEAKNINLSLTTLRRVIDVLLSNAKKRTKDIPPYRESMLTWVLKDSLGGNSKTMMIAAVSPHRSNIDDTLNTLRYALKAKAILLHAQVNEEKTATMLKSMKAEIEALQRQIRSGSGGGEVSEAALESHKREFEEALQQAESAAEQAKQEAAEDHAYMETQVKDEKRKNFAAAFRNAFAISRRKDETAALISSLKEELHREREARRQAEESKRKAEEALEQQEEKYRDNTRDKKIKIQVQQQTINDAKVYTQELRVSGHKLEMKNDELATEARHLREALKTERENTKHAQATVKSLQVSVAGLHDKNSNEMLELQDARNAIEMLHNKLKSAESRIRNQEQQNRELSKSATTHHDDKLQAEKSLQLTIERLMEKNGELEQQLQAKQSMISSLKVSVQHEHTPHSATSTT